MQFVRGDDTESRVAKFPPKLMTDGDDCDGARRFRSILDGVDHARRGQEKHQYDEYGNHGPSKFHLVTAIDLRRLAAVVAIPLAELSNGVRQEAEHNRKNGAGDRQDQQRQMKDRVCRRRLRPEDARNLRWTRRSAETERRRE